MDEPDIWLFIIRLLARYSDRAPYFGGFMMQNSPYQREKNVFFHFLLLPKYSANFVFSPQVSRYCKFLLPLFRLVHKGLTKLNLHTDFTVDRWNMILIFQTVDTNPIKNCFFQPEAELFCKK